MNSFQQIFIKSCYNGSVESQFSEAGDPKTKLCLVIWSDLGKWIGLRIFIWRESGGYDIFYNE